jgi:hypothetical protein
MADGRIRAPTLPGEFGLPTGSTTAFASSIMSLAPARQAVCTSATNSFQASSDDAAAGKVSDENAARRRMGRGIGRVMEFPSCNLGKSEPIGWKTVRQRCETNVVAAARRGIFSFVGTF